MHRYLRRSRTGALESTGLALAFGLSPYVFGSAFVLLTYSLAFLLWFGSTWAWTSGRPEGRVAGTGLLALAALTRQSVLWSIIPFAAHAAERRGRRLMAVGALLLLLVPVAAVVPFFALWGGFVPPQATHAHALNHVRLDTPFLGAAILGGYGIFLRGPALLAALLAGEVAYILIRIRGSGS